MAKKIVYVRLEPKLKSNPALYPFKSFAELSESGKTLTLLDNNSYTKFRKTKEDRWISTEGKDEWKVGFLKNRTPFSVYIVYSDEIVSSHTEGDPANYNGWYEEEREFKLISLHHRIGANEEHLDWCREKIEYLPFDPSKHKELYVVVVRYSTGSTFGCTEGCGRIQEVVQTEKEALKIKERIENDKYNALRRRCWIEFFDKPQSVEIHKMVVNK